MRSRIAPLFILSFCASISALAQSKRVGEQSGSVFSLESEVYSISTAALLPYKAVINDQIRNHYYRHLPALQQSLALGYCYRWQGVELGASLGLHHWGRQELLFPKFQELRLSNGRYFSVPSDRSRTDIQLAMLSSGVFVQQNFAWGQRVALGYRFGFAAWWMLHREVKTIYTGAMQPNVPAETRREIAWMKASPAWVGMLEWAPSLRVYTEGKQKSFVEFQAFFRLQLRSILGREPDWESKTEAQIVQRYSSAGGHYGVRLRLGLRP